MAIALNIKRMRIEVTSAAPCSDCRALDDLLVEEDGALSIAFLIKAPGKPLSPQLSVADCVETACCERWYW